MGFVLIYDPSQDPYHSAVRILSILQSQAIALAEDAVRIADFYLAYPSALEGFRFPAQLRRVRSIAAKYKTPYRKPAQGWTSFERMRPIFLAAVSGLVAADYLDTESAKAGRLLLLRQRIPSDLASRCDAYLERYSGLRSFICRDLAAIPLLGPDGLKARSGLLEFRYDPT